MGEINPINKIIYFNEINFFTSDFVHTRSAHFQNGEKCDGSKLLASVYSMPEQFENITNSDGKNVACDTLMP